VSHFDAIYPIIRAHEGGHTVDHAGHTAYGVTLAFLLDIVDQDPRLKKALDVNGDGRVDLFDLRRFEPRHSEEAFRSYFDVTGCDRIVNPLVAAKVFDYCVNMGTKRGVQLCQRASCAALHEDHWLKDDGVLGPKSLTVFNAVDPGIFFGSACAVGAAFYDRLVDINPSKYARFSLGWRRRAYSTVFLDILGETWKS